MAPRRPVCQCRAARHRRRPRHRSRERGDGGDQRRTFGGCSNEEVVDRCRLAAMKVVDRCRPAAV